ncbi:MAG: apolipoprotein N-acyltransferase [Candidatus Moraniibacteriota bacterium]
MWNREYRIENQESLRQGSGGQAGIRNKEYSLFLLPLASGIVCSITFDISWAWPLVFVALTPLLIFLTRARQKCGTRDAFAGGFLFGLIFFGVVLFWFFDSHPLDWAGVADPQTSLIFVSIAWAVSVIVLSLFTGAWAAAFQVFRRSTFFDITLGAALWVVFEWLRTFGFSLVSYGDGTFWGAHWTFGNLGYTLADSPFLPWASVGGMYLLSFIIVAVNIAFFLCVEKRFRLSQQTYIAATILAILFILATTFLSLSSLGHPSSPRISVALLYTDFPSGFSVFADESRTRREVFLSLLAQIREEKQKPDLVVFPEDTRFLASFSPMSRKALLQSVSGGTSMTFVDSARTTIDGKPFSVLSYYDENGLITGEYTKLLLVPHGEYLPFFTGGMARLFGNGAWADAFMKSREYARGESPVVVRTGQGNFGSLFCSEILSDVLYGTLARDGAEVLINNASLSFAHGSMRLARQTRIQARMRAAETGRFFLRAANAGTALVITPDGTVIAESARSTGVLYADIARIATQTLFTRLGNWMLWLSLIICAYGIVQKRKTVGRGGGGISRT